LKEASRAGAKVAVDREFFLSFTGEDRPWAEWLLAELDTAGYSSVSQLRDFVAGANFALDMDRAARRTNGPLGVLSPHALQAPYVQQEWAQRLRFAGNSAWVIHDGAAEPALHAASADYGLVRCRDLGLSQQMAHSLP
jgi:hypothetical protein